MFGNGKWKTVLALVVVLCLSIAPVKTFGAVEQESGSYVALGDSLAAGMTPENDLGPSYVDYLAEKMGYSNGEYFNFGVPGLMADDLDEILTVGGDPQFAYMLPLLTSGALSTDEIGALMLELTRGSGLDPAEISAAMEPIVMGLSSGTEIGIRAALDLVLPLMQQSLVNTISDAAIITLDIGGNDLRQALIASGATSPSEVAAVASAAAIDIGTDVKSILDTINGINPDAKVYVMGYPYNTDLMRSLNGAIEQAVLFHNGTYDDGIADDVVFVETATPAMEKHYDKYFQWTAAGYNVHPYKQGYMALAKELWSAIK